MNRTIKDEGPSESLIQDKQRLTYGENEAKKGAKKAKINTKVFRMDFSDRDEEESIEFIQIQDKVAKGPGNSEQIRGNQLLNPRAHMNETIKGSEFNDINIDNINENILKMQGQEQETLGDQSIDLSQSNFDFNSKNIQLIEKINSLIANSGKAGANQHKQCSKGHSVELLH